MNQGQIGMSTEGIRQFIDEKSFKPGIGTVRPDQAAEAQIGSRARTAASDVLIRTLYCSLLWRESCAQDRAAE
ncbi:MAG: hypothetical protein QOD56_2166 [Gammaproteobacteria bacterium]|nr:hypothetical protein [Gammaproteobacteria bacterium]